MADNADGEFAEVVVILVGQCLRRSHDNALSRMYSERVEVLHVADRDAVVILVPDHLVLDFLPALQGFLHENLRGERESLGTEFLELLVILAEAGPETSEGICSPDNQRVTEGMCRSLGLLH